MPLNVQKIDKIVIIGLVYYLINFFYYFRTKNLLKSKNVEQLIEIRNGFIQSI